MDKKNIDEAKHEALRFLKRLKEYEAREDHESKQDYRCIPTKESGALKRVSLDLSRALAKMRKPYSYYK